MDIPASSDPVKLGMTTPTPPEGGKLLPCPFCGGEATDAHLTGSAWFIGGDHSPTCHLADFQRSEIEATAAWNARADQWQPIESAPKNGVRVFLSIPAGIPTVEPSFRAIFAWQERPCARGGDKGCAWFDDANRELRGTPTAWQPLPAPPRAAP